MRKVGIMIAIENYVDKRIPNVDYAEADARALAEILRQHDFDSADQLVLINNEATHVSIESRVRKILSGMAKDDILYFYYTGHGFARNGRNYITCNDTFLNDLENTSIPVEWLFEQFKKSDCKKIVMFLDSCESGMLATTKVRGIYSDLTKDELEDFFDNAEHCVCFAACKPGQSSHPSDELKHGIWTYHVIEAFNANATLALEKGHLLTSSSLQNYLKKEVPRTIRTTYTGKIVQTPWFYGAASGDFLIADVGPIIEKRKTSANPTLQQLKRIVIYGKSLGDIKGLSGFKKRFHHVPDSATDAANAFVAKIATQEISDDIKEKYEALRAAFGFKRRDLTADGPEDGAGTIITPFFDYNVDVRVNPKDTSEVLWRREIVNIREPEKILSDEFDRVFPDIFDTLEFQVTKEIDIKDLIDQIEDSDEDQIHAEFDHECTYCRLRIKGFSSSITITTDAVRLKRTEPGSPRKLIEDFFAAQKLLVDKYQIRQLPFAKSGD